ncbi:MAG: hypothetical protein ACM3H8_05065 [Sphingobacteriales bacterium]
MKFLLFELICITALLVGMTGCSKKNTDSTYMSPGGGNTGNNQCDTTVVKYSTDIVPIMQTICYNCHGNGNTSGSGGYLLEGYANLKPWATDGHLVGNVTHAPGYVAMPYNLPKLSDCNINKIVAWVHQGALNN